MDSECRGLGLIRKISEYAWT